MCRLPKYKIPQNCRKNVLMASRPSLSFIKALSLIEFLLVLKVSPPTDNLPLWSPLVGCSSRWLKRFYSRFERVSKKKKIGGSIDKKIDNSEKPPPKENYPETTGNGEDDEDGVPVPECKRKLGKEVL